MYTPKILLKILPFSTLCLLIILLLTTTTTITFKKPANSKTLKTSNLHISHHIRTAQSSCQGTLYPNLCFSTISSFKNLSSQSLTQIISSIIKNTIDDVRISSSNCSNIQIRFRKKLEPIDQNALIDCLELFDSTIVEFKSAILDLSNTSTNQSQQPSLKTRDFHDLQTLLSGAMTNQFTCLDGFAYSKSRIRHTIESRLRKISRHVSNSLAMLKKVPRVKKSKSDKREVFPEYGSMHDGYPTWLSKKDRKLLQTSTNSSSVKYNLMVAKDGTGNFTTINAALAAAPNSSASRFVIYIKAGAYFEYIEVARKTINLMFLGDGIGKTLIKGNRSVVDGWTTFRSSTVAVLGTNFLMKGITVENYAGAIKHQAVALRSGADFSAFYQCSFIGYQDTLYVHSLRQFYRECDIYGTVDFIFGNAAVVFQNSNLYARRPLANQQNIFTAQGREDPNQNTGISIINCKVEAASDLIPVKSNFSNYLGRPWKEYSRTVYLLSNIGDLIKPVGWLEWNGSFALSTLYYGEYKNRGLGSNTTARVKWPGYKVITNVTEASQFTAGAFIQGSDWLNSTGFPHFLNLTA